MRSKKFEEENELVVKTEDVDEEIHTTETSGYDPKLYHEEKKAEKDAEKKAEERKKEENKQKISELKSRQKQIKKDLKDLEETKVKISYLQEQCKKYKISYRGTKKELKDRLKKQYEKEDKEISKKISELQPPKKSKGGRSRSKWMNINLEHQDLTVREWKDEKDRQEQESRSEAKYEEIRKKILNRYVIRDQNVKESEPEGDDVVPLDEIRRQTCVIIISFEETKNDKEHKHFHIYYSQRKEISNKFIIQERAYWEEALSYVDPETGEETRQKSNQIKHGDKSQVHWQDYICKEYRSLGVDKDGNERMSVEGYENKITKNKEGETQYEIKKMSTLKLETHGKVQRDKIARKNVRAATGINNTPQKQELNDIGDNLFRMFNLYELKVEFSNRKIYRFETSLEKWGYHQVSQKEFMEICNEYFSTQHEGEQGTDMIKIIGLSGLEQMHKLINVKYSTHLPYWKPDEKYIGFSNCKFNVVTGLPEPYPEGDLRKDEIHCKYYSRYEYKHMPEVPKGYVDILKLQEQRCPRNRPFVKRWLDALKWYTRPKNSHPHFYPGPFLFGDSRTGKNVLLLPVHEVDAVFCKQVEANNAGTFTAANFEGCTKIRIEEGNIFASKGAFQQQMKQNLDDKPYAADVKGKEQIMIEPKTISQTSNDDPPVAIKNREGKVQDEHEYALIRRADEYIFELRRRISDPIIDPEEAANFWFMIEQHSANIVARACINQKTYWGKLKYTDEELGITSNPNVYLTRQDIYGKHEMFDYDL